MFRASDIFGRKPGGAMRKPIPGQAESAQEKRPHELSGPSNRTWDPATGSFIEEEIPYEVQMMMGVKKQKVQPAEPSAPPAARVLGPKSVGLGSKGLRVALSGFSKQELNAEFVEKRDEEVQGRASFWDRMATYFIYWQSSMNRWAICDSASFHSAKSGLPVGWAFKTDSSHFAIPGSWMESERHEWKSAHIRCRVLEGSITDTSAFSKAVKEESADSSNRILSIDQYKILARRIYQEKNPSKVADVDYLFEKYKGKEDELFTQVCTKYEANVESLVASLPASAPKDQARPAAAESELKDDDCPELSAAQYAILVQNAFERFNPPKLADLPKLLQKYRQRERELYLLVCSKYGLHPAEFHFQCETATKDEN